MGNIARQLRQEQQEQTIKAPKKDNKTKELDFSWGKDFRYYLWSFGLFWFRPYHFQSGIYLPNE